ncbi:kinase [Fusarium beomiforme]|uniref:Kinase n=1 Tax=Fusarium beomiforme TaxID=44412 RepID=A0A9P5AAN9_9HYPO|nr:kinase [Fusarium beomiforme]
MVEYLSAGSDVLNLPNTLTNIVSIVQKISTQRRSGKEKCAELLLDALTLKDMIRSPNATDPLPPERLENLIFRIKDCLEKFSKQNWLDDTIEALFINKYSQLRHEYKELRERHMFGAVTRRDSFGHKVQETKRNPTPGPMPFHLTIDISSLNFEGSVGRGYIEGYGDVECRRLNTSLTSQRALYLYRDFQQGSHIQKIYGIVERNNHDYVVMQGCSELQPLKAWRSDSNRGLTLRDRVVIAYDVAQSIAWLHEGGLLVKYLTESSIRLTSDGQSGQEPILTQLHYTRCLYEKTNSVRIDYRYEAPEILSTLLEVEKGQQRRSLPHSHETDIWSLGIIIWQILTDGVPYQIEDDLYFYNPEQESARLKSHLDTSPLPGDFPSECPLRLADIIRKCWSPIDQGRPSAECVASSLLRALPLLDKTVMNTVTSCTGGLDEIGDPQELKQARSAAWELVQAARAREKKQAEQVSQLSDDYASILLRYANDPKHPECTFLVGSLIWWELINIWLINDLATPRKRLGFNGQRAELALKYLLSASDGMLMQANLEISRAYAALYHDYNVRIKPVTDLS